LFSPFKRRGYDSLGPGEVFALQLRLKRAPRKPIKPCDTKRIYLPARKSAKNATRDLRRMIKSSLGSGSYIRERELYVREFLDENLGFSEGFPLGSPGFSGHRNTI